MDSVKIVDGTLREGEQTPGVHFTVKEKIEIARELDMIGVPVLDAGMPSISKEEREAISAIVDLGLKASVGVSVRMRREEIDQALQCGVREVFIICSVSPIHIRSKLETDEAGLRKMAEDTVNYAEQKGVVVNFVAEDAARAEGSFLCDILCRAHDWGAKRGFICDTVGVMEPFKMKRLVERVKAEIPAEMKLGVHCHDDLGLSTANTLAAVEAGVEYPSVTVNGIGERAGNAPLHEVAVGIEKILRLGNGIQMNGLYSLCKLVEKCSGVFIPLHAPIIGLNAFRHESGIHVDGLLKNKRTYTGLDPQDVNRTSAFVLGKHAGTQGIRNLLQERGYNADEGKLERILNRVKEKKEKEGKQEIRRMVKEIERFHERHLNFPEEEFWRIVEQVIGGNE